MVQSPGPANQDDQARQLEGRALDADFDHDPERFAANQLATQNFSMIGDVHDRVAERLAKITTGPILDLGGGNGTLAKSLARQGRGAIVVDRADYVRSAPRPAVQADATRLPFRAECFAAVAALWMLYYLDEPALALVEASRVLRPGGIFVACTSSRYNDPEFASVLPGWGEPFSFDAETAKDHF
jgi:ubiquinone/menaquinone biosynthesis C-methylase UbiE